MENCGDNLRCIVEAAGMALEYLMTIGTRQAISLAARELLASLLLSIYFLIAVIKLPAYGKKVDWETIDISPQQFVVIAGWVFAIIALPLAIAYLFHASALLINPEYYAIQMLFDLLP